MGDAVEQCTIAMGDWNVPARHVDRLWSQLIGGKTPKTVFPDKRTCCWPESHHYGIFDHLASNIQGARHAGETVHPYQLLEENPVKQHKPSLLSSLFSLLSSLFSPLSSLFSLLSSLFS